MSVRIKTKASKILKAGKGRHGLASGGKNKALRVRTLAVSHVVGTGYNGRLMSRSTRLQDAMTGKTSGITPVKAPMCACPGAL